MRALLTGKQMKEVDHRTIHEIGIPSLVLMERAAMAVAEEVKRRVKKTEKTPKKQIKRKKLCREQKKK